ncbi:aspartate aminotransferase [Desulfonema ishimotonii]|uniref:Aminotransferase n=1 Tax=Desulfonema ishimotonii TaxID=45657 RepID=A0A401G3L1_9BACT|nr:pyridoxal phosphate-dependent aminotransferase [Desulfonema ishimotonii]GBC63820.1 aspartate aminotransferase [Desulfonema ishimotonii]
MSIANKIKVVIEKSSWIRKMFEEGGRLRAQHGADKVFDFSLGNPNLPPPDQFNDVLRDTVDACGLGDHCYMPNTGYPEVCKCIADYLCTEQQAEVTEKEVIMTCGAAGALNVILKTLLDPGDEVLVPAPYFVEYNAYADNHGGVLKTVPTRPDFTLDLDAMAGAVTEKTKAVLINSPNNPTGQIYSGESLMALGQMLTEKGRAFNRTIYLLSDEPYRKIVYDGAVVPSIFRCYNESIIATSYSKDLSIPGERLGFIAVSPDATYKSDLMAGLTLANRILGFVNAPALMQRVVSCLQGVSVDMSEYARKRKLLCDGLAECGYEFITPPGAFYLFPKSPIPDDVEFVRALQEELILAVPGSGFGGPGHFRLAFCVDDATITNAMPGFRRAIEKFK